MNFLRSAVSEIIGLFVNNWVFALLLIVWIALFSVLRGHLPIRAAAFVFFGGIALLTLTFIARKARAARSA